MHGSRRCDLKMAETNAIRELFDVDVCHACETRAETDRRGRNGRWSITRTKVHRTFHRSFPLQKKKNSFLFLSSSSSLSLKKLPPERLHQWTLCSPSPPGSCPLRRAPRRRGSPTSGPCSRSSRTPRSKGSCLRATTTTPAAASRPKGRPRPPLLLLLLLLLLLPSSQRPARQASSTRSCRSTSRTSSTSRSSPGAATAFAAEARCRRLR